MVEVAGPRDIRQAVLTAILPSGDLQQLTSGHYVLNKDVDPKRLGSENNAMKHNKLTRSDTAGI